MCSGFLIEKNVETLLKGGNDVASYRADALVCSKCGERVYPVQLVKRFEKIRRQLTRGDISDFEPIGHSYKVTVEEPE
ncbi:MAG: YgiT-type zinc finger protein [SAR202 cluster bacterium]|nr:YgiT-type zinc finger protein [SAR202 cluster bacterium]MDP6715799.1 YgiT-type zinc finger protein [SAR202 cluster bacterium]